MNGFISAVWPLLWIYPGRRPAGHSRPTKPGAGRHPDLMRGGLRPPALGQPSAVHPAFSIPENQLGRRRGRDRRPLGLRGWAREGGGTPPARGAQGPGPAGPPLGFCSETCSVRSPPPEQAGDTESLLQACTRFQAVPRKATPGFLRQDGPP